MLAIFIIVVALVGLLAAAIAASANRKWPTRSIAQLTKFTVFVLVVGFFIVMVALLIWAMTMRCSEDDVCDAPAMAALGAIFLASLFSGAAVIVGAPVAFFTVRRIRRS